MDSKGFILNVSRETITGHETTCAPGDNTRLQGTPSNRLDLVNNLLRDRQRLLVLHRQVGVPWDVDSVEDEDAVLEWDELRRRGQREPRVVSKP